MPKVEKAAVKYRKQAKELRAEAANTSDSVMRETLLNAAETCEQAANGTTRNSKE
jgi:hypothetical protein